MTPWARPAMAVAILLALAPPAYSATQTQDLWKAITPVYAAPYPEFSPGWIPLPMRLLGVDLAQNGTPLSGDQPEIDTGTPLAITCYWLAESNLNQKREFELKVASHDGQLARSEEVKAGPDSAGWELGSVYRQTFEFDLAPVASTITGDAFLLLSVFPRQPASAAPVPLQRVPIRLKPTVRPGRISERNLASALNASYHDLSASFRLGRNARLTLDVPPDLGKTATAIAVVSSLSYGSAPQGENVCEIIANKTGETAAHTFQLRSGIDTARSDIDFYAPGSVNHEKAAVIQSWDAEYPDVFNKPFKKHAYISLLPLPENVRNLSTIEFSSKTPYVLDIFDVLLVQASPQKPPTQTP